MGIVAGVALALRVLDAVPGWLLGIPRGVHVCETLAQAEARSGVDLDSVRALAGWQVVGIRATGAPQSAVAVDLRRSGGTDFAFYRSREGALPATLCPRLRAFHSLEVTLAPGRMGLLQAELGTDGAVVQDLTFWDGGRETVLRSAGRTVELLELAKLLVTVPTHDPHAHAPP